jgi:transcriptional regulator with XRE-family HTH domain
LAEGTQPKKGGSERSARLRKLLILMNEGNERDKLTISEIAEQLNLEKITHLENYLKGTDEPPMALLKQIAGLFFVNLEWLLHGKGEPFYHAEPFFDEALNALDMIRKSEPERIFFVRCNTPEGGGTNRIAIRRTSVPAPQYVLSCQRTCGRHGQSTTAKSI